MCKMKRQNIKNEYLMPSECNCFQAFLPGISTLFSKYHDAIFPSRLVNACVADQQIELIKSTSI